MSGLTCCTSCAHPCCPSWWLPRSPSAGQVARLAAAEQLKVCVGRTVGCEGRFLPELEIVWLASPHLLRMLRFDAVLTGRPGHW